MKLPLSYLFENLMNRRTNYCLFFPSQRSRNEMTSSPPLSRPLSKQVSAAKMSKQIDTQSQSPGAAAVTRLGSSKLPVLQRSLSRPSLRRSGRHRRGWEGGVDEEPTC